MLKISNVNTVETKAATAELEGSETLKFNLFNIRTVASRRGYPKKFEAQFSMKLIFELRTNSTKLVEYTPYPKSFCSYALKSISLLKTSVNRLVSSLHILNYLRD